MLSEILVQVKTACVTSLSSLQPIVTWFLLQNYDLVNHIVKLYVNKLPMLHNYIILLLFHILSFDYSFV